jgi:porin
MDVSFWNRPGRSFAATRIETVFVATFYATLTLGSAAFAKDADSARKPSKIHSVKAKQITNFKQTAKIRNQRNIGSELIVSRDSVAISPVAAASPARLDKAYNYKGWDMPFPSFGDTLLQDYGGFRTALASYGFGIIHFNIDLFQWNMLNTPSKVPVNFPHCTSALGTACAGSQLYFGQRPSIWNTGTTYLTYDLSRWGIPDGQFQIAASASLTGDQAFQPVTYSFSTVAWYQTLFNKQLEIKAGINFNSQEFIGSAVGGNFANPFGGAASIPVELGQSAAGTPAPTFRVTWHMTDTVYNEFAVQRSLPVNGPTGNPLYDAVHSNRTGLQFNSPVPGTRVLYMDELGYKNEATPGGPANWARFGVMYNTSDFKDLSKVLTDPTATISGNSAMYFYADRQIWQQAPSSPQTAYRGLYAGVAAMYTPPQTAAFSQYYEGRLYWVGPFDPRPTDMVALVYFHNAISSYVADATNHYSALTGIYGRSATNTISLSYTAHLMPGAYATVGIQYTDHPSITYFKSEGSALNFLASIAWVL